MDIENINLTTHRNHHLKIFCDAHFYFICIGQVSKCLKRLSDELKNKNIYKIKSDFMKVFKQEIRNDLEHIDARAVGKKIKGNREVSIGHIRDFRNFSNDNLTFNGKSYPVNKDSLNELKGFYKRTISVIHEDYAMKDPHFVSNIIRDENLKKVMKIAQKEYQKFLHAKQNKKH
jgi:hypothetical protein